jgi:tricorn protease-like protein
MGKSNQNKCIETSSQVTCIKLDTTGEAIVVGNNEGMMMIYDTEYGRKIRTIK